MTQQAFINEILQDWAADVDAILREELSKRADRVPSETLRNLQYQVLEAAAQSDSSQYLLQFQDSGRHVDMRRLDFRKRPITPEGNFILEWVKKQGVEKFRFVPGYSQKSRGKLSKEQQASRIAAAIIVQKSTGIRRRRKRRRSAWFNRTFYAQVGALVRRILDEQTDYVRRETVKDLKEQLTGR